MSNSVQRRITKSFRRARPRPEKRGTAGRSCTKSGIFDPDEVPQRLRRNAARVYYHFTKGYKVTAA